MISDNYTTIVNQLRMFWLAGQLTVTERSTNNNKKIIIKAIMATKLVAMNGRCGLWHSVLYKYGKFLLPELYKYCMVLFAKAFY